MAAFDLALTRVQQGMDDLLSPDQINQLARSGNVPFRGTTLTPGNTLRLFVQQVAHGNVACCAMRHLAGENFSDSAWCQARRRLPLELIQQAQRQVVEQARRESGSAGDLLVCNLIRMVMLRAARRQGINVHRLSFADALAWLRHGELNVRVELLVNPLRSGRLEPRVIKRQKKEFPYMTKPRAVLKAQLREKYGVNA